MSDQKSSFAKASEDKAKKQASQKTDVEKLKKEIDELKKQIEDYKNKYLRALADYQNYEKRVKEEKDIVQQVAVINVLLQLLPFLDNLDKAEVFFKDAGLKMVKDSFNKTLQEIGLEEIQVLDKEFDPHLAEAIDVIKGDKDNIVREVLRKGYKYNGKILRVAQVKVSKKIIN
ncbi:nucleotide exchange factor GrpE [Candidatus Roizmanbacteria bacterium]|nr:nucleotide exchange factor GrpE [Candidatus Roizmanbacteria bacterium]